MNHLERRKNKILAPLEKMKTQLGKLIEDIRVERSAVSSRQASIDEEASELRAQQVQLDVFENQVSEQIEKFSGLL